MRSRVNCRWSHKLGWHKRMAIASAADNIFRLKYLALEWGTRYRTLKAVFRLTVWFVSTKYSTIAPAILRHCPRDLILQWPTCVSTNYADWSGRSTCVCVSVCCILNFKFGLYHLLHCCSTFMWRRVWRWVSEKNSSLYFGLFSFNPYAILNQVFP